MTNVPESLVSTFYGLFNSSHVLLFVGQNTSDEDLKSYIAKEPWSAVVTTRKDVAFQGFFSSPTRNPIEYHSREDIRGSILSREKMPIIRLLENESHDPDETDLFLNQLLGSQSPESIDNRTRELLDYLPALVGYTNFLVVTGVDCEKDRCILNSFCNILTRQLVQNSVFFWGFGLNENSSSEIVDIYRAIADRQFYFFDDRYGLAEVVKCREDQEEEALQADYAEVGEDRLYRAQQPVPITRADYVSISRIGTLLTERVLHRIHPQGRVQQSQWFSNFLECSSVDGPQWYGYLPQSIFYVKRRFEDSLVQVVRRALNGHGVGGAGPDDLPIILSGDPASSKSITLGALAYRIYNEKVCPVLYIPSGTFLGNSFGDENDNLIDALETISALGEQNTRILVIWDSSSYRSTIEDAYRLLSQIRNRGRRVVLVCSSYAFDATEKAEYFKLKNTDSCSFTRCSKEDGWAVRKGEKSISVRSSREMNEEEKNAFWHRAESYSGLPSTRISFIRRKLEAENNDDIFEHYYRLISILRERLEGRLRNEQNKVTQYIRNELARAAKIHVKEDPEEPILTPMEKQLLKAGLCDLSDIIKARETNMVSDDINSSRQTDKIEMIELASQCVALFSRFKLDVPYDLIYSLISEGDGANPYSANGRALFDMLTGWIPWLHCGENEQETYIFRFRTALEADIYLQEHHISGKEQVELVCRLMRLYGEEYIRTRCINYELADKLLALIRLMGPNSKYTPFIEGDRQAEHREILSKMDLVIQAIDDLGKRYNVPDDEFDFKAVAITLIREFFGIRGWDRRNQQAYASPKEEDSSIGSYSIESYEKRLNCIKRAADSASYCIDDLLSNVGLERSAIQRNAIRNKIDMLAVESALCAMEYDSVAKEYRNQCEIRGITPKKALLKESQPYRVSFRQLSAALRRQPTNGYVYNTLFKAFENAYKDTRYNYQQKMQFLTQVMGYVDDCLAYGEAIEDHGELRDHIFAIKRYADSYDYVSIDLIRTGRECKAAGKEDSSAFLSLYESLIGQGDPAAITFVCRQELRTTPAVLAANDHENWEKYKNVLRFMLEEENYECIRNDANALAMLIETAWTCYTGTKLKSSKECRLTKLSIDQWKNLNEFCSQYAAKTTEEQREPIIMLLFALSELQIARRSEQGYRDAYDIVSQIEEEAFRGISRMKTPFLICDEAGAPIRYEAVVCETIERSRTGRAKVAGVPEIMGGKIGVHFRLYNLTLRRMPRKGMTLSNVALGIGYRGFNLFDRQVHEEDKRAE